ncbi:UNVERIFIED_ORG: fimbrial chaperone protein [Pseudomonas psychrophila]
MLRSLSNTARQRLSVRIGTALIVLMACALPAQAALTLSTTRVIFNGDKRSASLIVANPSTRIYAVQAWVNTALDDTISPVPFMPSPSLFRLNSGKQQQVQINGLPNDLPSDKESLFYFNVQEIPQASPEETNVLTIALRTRIKLFYRPAQLRGNPIDGLMDLKWSLQTDAGTTHLVVNNPTAFHVTFGRIELLTGNHQQELKNIDMVLPMQALALPLQGLTLSPDMQVRFTAINDYGGASKPVSAPIKQTP